MAQPLLTKNRSTLWHFAVIAVAVVVAYLRVFHAGFMAWDDGEYVLHNNSIIGINANNINTWFSSYYLGNYQPLTMVSYAFDFSLGGTSPVIYHTTSILLHICNACVVYLLLRRLQPHDMVALSVALLFAVHPMQTESVSWIAERKTLVAGLFYLLALHRYTGYVASPSRGKMVIVIALSACAMLSKGTAVALPLSLIAIDVWLNRSLKGTAVWLEKTPLFLLSLIIGIVAIKAQESGEFMNRHASYTVIEQVIFAGYAYTQYIVRLFVPVGLSAMYPYPAAIGLIHYLSLAGAISLLAGAYIAYRKGHRILAGGILFYTANIIFVLQFVRFGEALMADRYMYLASIGILYPAVYYLYRALQQRKLAPALTGGIAALLLVLSFFRNDIWLSDMNFFSALLKTFPDSAVTQYSIGALYLKEGNYAESEIHLEKAVRIEPNNYKAWCNKGMLYLKQGRAMEALEALNRSIDINGYPKAYFTRAVLHRSTRQYDMAIADLEHVLAAQPGNSEAHFYLGITRHDAGQSPCKDLQKAMQLGYPKAREALQKMCK